MPFRAAWEKKSGSDTIGFSGSGFAWIKNDDSVDGGDCDDGFCGVCGCDEEELAQRMVAAIVHLTGRVRQNRDNRIKSVTPTFSSPN